MNSTRHPPPRAISPEHPWYPLFRQHLSRRGVTLEEAGDADWADFVGYFSSLSAERQAVEIADAKEVNCGC